MKNLTLLLVLVSGLLAGYLVGDYRGKAAREALQNAIATGKTLSTEREATISRLKTELGNINAIHQRELAAIRKDYDIRTTAWRHSKDRLNNVLDSSNRKLAESDARLKSLLSQRDAASGADKTRLETEIVHLQKEQAELRKQIEGNNCLQAQVPRSVFEALNETDTGGRQ